MSNKVYDILKRVQRFLPSLSVFLATVLALYNVPAATIAVVVGTVDAVTVLLGAILEESTKRYNSAVESLNATIYATGIDHTADAKEEE